MKRTILIVFVLVQILLLADAVRPTGFGVYVERPPGTKPVYRFWHSRIGCHFYTMDEAEKAKLINQYSHVWVYEGIAWNGWPVDPNQQ